jgi:hypothetical protein
MNPALLICIPAGCARFGIPGIFGVPNRSALYSPAELG